MRICLVHETLPLLLALMISKLTKSNSDIKATHVGASDFDYDFDPASSKASNIAVYAKRVSSKAMNFLTGVERTHAEEIEDNYHWRRESARQKTYSPNDWTKDERAAYFDMLKRQKDRRRRLKKLRQQARRMGDEVLTEGFVDSLQDSLGGILDIATGLFAETKSRAFLPHLVRRRFRDTLSSLQDEESNSALEELTKVLEQVNNVASIVHCILTCVGLLHSDNIYMDIILIGMHISAMNLTTHTKPILKAIVPLLLLMRTGYRWLKRRNIPDTEADGDVEEKKEEEKNPFTLSSFIYEGRGKVADFITSHFMLAIREIILILAHFHLFPRKIARQFNLWLGRIDPPKSIPEAVSRITTDVAHLVKMGEAYADGKPLSDVMLAADPTKEAKVKYDTLMYQHTLLYFGMPVEGRFDGRTWVMEARNLVEVMRSMQKTLNPYHVHTEVLNTRIRSLMEKLTLVQCMCYRDKRATPFCIVVVGPPGIGKSSVVTYVCQLWSNAMGRVFDQSHVFSRIDSDYWDGVDPLSHPIYHYSELGSESKKLAEMGKSTSVMELLSIVDSLPYMLNMSKAEDKGTFYAMPEMVIADTNNPGLNLDVLVKNKAAYERRIVYLEPCVKPEFRKNVNLPGIDGNKQGDDFMDKWTFRLTRKRPISNTVSEDVVIMDHANPEHDIFHLTHVLRKMMVDHYTTENAVLQKTTQDWVVNSADKIRNILENRGMIARRREPVVVANERVNTKDLTWYRPEAMVPEIVLGLIALSDKIGKVPLDILEDRDFMAVYNETKRTHILNYLNQCGDLWDPTGMYTDNAEGEASDESSDSDEDYEEKHFTVIEDEPLLDRVEWVTEPISVRSEDEWTEYWSGTEIDGPVDTEGLPSGGSRRRGKDTYDSWCEIDEEVDRKMKLKRKQRTKHHYRHVTALADHKDDNSIPEIKEAEGLSSFSKARHDFESDVKRELASYDRQREHILAKFRMDREKLEKKFLFSREHVDRCVLGNAPGNASEEEKYAPDMRDLCDCCEYGVHVPGKLESLKIVTKDVAKMITAFAWAVFCMCIGSLFSFPRVFKECSLEMQLLLITTLAMMAYPPYAMVYIVTSCCASGLVKIISLVSGVPYAQLVRRELMRQVWARYRKTVNSAVDYCRRKPHYVIAGTGLAATIIYLIPKIVRAMFKLVSPDTESQFVVDSKDNHYLADMEEKYGFRPPYNKVKSKLSGSFYGDNVIVLPTPKCQPNNGMSLINLAFKNTRLASFTTFYKDGSSKTNKSLIFGIKSYFAVFHLHQIDYENGVSFEVSYSESAIAYNEDKTPRYSASVTLFHNQIGIVSSDMGMIRLQGTLFKDLCKHIPPESLPIRNMNIKILGFSSVANDIGNIQCNNRCFEGYTVQEDCIAYEWKEHKPGSCGTPIIGETNAGWWILALHSAGDRGGKKSYAMKLNRKLLQQQIDFLSKGNIQVFSAPDVESLETVYPTSRSWCHYIPQNNVTCFGQIHPFNGNQKSSLVKSIFSKEERFYLDTEELFTKMPETSWLPASMKPTSKGSPITNGAIKLTGVRKGMNLNTLKLCGDLAFEKICENLQKLKVERNLAPFDMDTAVNGHPNDEFARRIDMSKGGGFDYPGNKRNYFVCVDEDKFLYESNDRLKSDIRGIFEAYEAETSTMPVFKASLKDELRSYDKVRAHKTRVFYASPLPFLTVHKMMMGPLYTLMVRHSDAFYSALGIDMHKQGHRVRQRLNTFAKNRKSSLNVGAGDYGGFDTSMPYGIGEEAARLSYRLLEWLGYTPDQLRLLNGVLTDLMYPCIDYFGDLCLVPGLQPSGKYGTAEDNSLRDLLIIMYGWYSHDTLRKHDFFENVYPILYGDDVLYAVVDKFSNDYNDLRLQQVCSDIGLTYTSSKKGEVEIPFVEHSEIDFLKRRDRYHPALKRQVSALSIDSIFKTLEWISPSKGVNIEVQYESICRSALIEFFFHATEKEYNNLKDFLTSTLCDNYPGASFNFPPYEYLVEFYTISSEEDEEWESYLKDL